MHTTTTLLSPTEARCVRRLLAAHGLRGPDLDDGLQEVTLRLLARAPSNGPILPWALTVARNLAIDHHRRQRRAQLLGERLGTRSTGLVPDPDIAARVAMAAALGGLTPEHRAVVRLHLLADLTLAETARRLAIPEGTVKSRLHRALAQLRRRLGVSQGQGARGPPAKARGRRGQSRHPA